MSSRLWSGTAFNQVPDAVNQIHGDEMAKEYGFEGALVPGATTCAYLLHPFVEAHGMAYLKDGYAHVRLNASVYDGSLFEVEADEKESLSWTATLASHGRDPIATAEIKVSNELGRAPIYKGDELGDEHSPAPMGSRENMLILKERGCKAFGDRWTPDHTMGTYLKDRSLMASLYGLEGYANPGFIVGMTNWVLASNIHMNPWILVEVWSQNYAPIAEGSKILGELEIGGLFERKGHEFVGADINLFDADDKTCYSKVRLRAIYRVRGSWAVT